MKEAIGGSWLFVLVILFVALFTGYICISTNYSRCYKIKDSIIEIVEKKHGINKDTIKAVNARLREVGYRSAGTCPSTGSGCWHGFSTNRDDNRAQAGDKTNYCIQKHVLVDCIVDPSHPSYGNCSGALGHPQSAYYSVMVFFQLDLPIFNDLFKLRIEGETSPIYLVRDDLIPDSDPATTTC